MQVTFQLVITTNGLASFATFIYHNNDAISSYIDSYSSLLNIGFDAGLEFDGFADFGTFVLNNGLALEVTNIFRIDGMCILIFFAMANCVM